MCTPLPAFSFGLSLTPLPCTSVTALHVRKACQFPHVLAELRYCCFSSDRLSLSLNHDMNIGSFFVFLFPLRHLDFFEMVRNEDDLELAKRFDLVSFSLEKSELAKAELTSTWDAWCTFPWCSLKLMFDFDAENGWCCCFHCFSFSKQEVCSV